MEKVKIIYSKICTVLSLKKITWITILGFILSILPICYLSFVNRATGDDYGYGIFTRAAWVETHSLIEVLKASWMTIKQYYVGWQGTWFDILFDGKSLLIYNKLDNTFKNNNYRTEEQFVKFIKNIHAVCFVNSPTVTIVVNSVQAPSRHPEGST